MSASEGGGLGGAGPRLGERGRLALEALRAAEGPLTAGELGRRIGAGKHEARSLLHRLLELGLARWSAEGWLADSPEEREGRERERLGLARSRGAARERRRQRPRYR